MDVFTATPINYEILRNIWEHLADPAQTDSAAVIRKSLQRYHQWLELKFLNNSTQFEPWPPVPTTEQHLQLTPAIGSQAAKPGSKFAPMKPKRTTHSTQAAAHTRAAVTGACDDLTSGGSQTGNSKKKPAARLVIVGDVNGGQFCRSYFDSGQSYFAGMAKGELHAYPALMDLVRDYEELPQPRLVRTAGTGVAFYVVAQGVLKFNLFLAPRYAGSF